MAELSRIKELYQNKGLTINELAKNINLGIEGIKQIIKKNSTQIKTLEKIAQCLDVPVSYFFPDDPNSTIYFTENDRNMIELDIEANGLSDYKYEILNALNFVGTDIKGKFVDLDNKTSSITKEGIINEIFIRYIMKRGHDKELNHMRKIIEDKEQIIEFLNEKLKSMKDGQSQK